MNESQAGAKHIYAKLTGAAAVIALVTEIHEGLAPQGSALPQVVYTLNAALPDLVAAQAHRIYGQDQWAVLARCEGGSFAPADAIYAAVDDALHNVSSTNLVLNGTTYTVVLSRRIRGGIRYVETNAGRRLQVVGGIYEVQVTTC